MTNDNFFPHRRLCPLTPVSTDSPTPAPKNRPCHIPWHQEILPIASYDQSGGLLFTTVPGLYDLSDDPQERPAQAWVMNTKAGINTPGEWASLDGKIYLHPKSGTNDIYVPRLTELVRIDDGTVDGTVDGNAAVTNPVRNITFDGLTFTGGDFRVLQDGEGANLADRDVTAQHDWAVVDEPDALLRIRTSRFATRRLPRAAGPAFALIVMVKTSSPRYREPQQ